MAAKSMEDIARILKEVKFKRKLFGGVSEDDVWRVLEKMQREYSAVLDAQRQWYEALIAEREQGAPHREGTVYGSMEGTPHA